MPSFRQHRRTSSNVVVVAPSAVSEVVGRGASDGDQHPSNDRQLSRPHRRASNAVAVIDASSTRHPAQQQLQHQQQIVRSHEAVDMTPQTDGQRVIFDLYPQHTSTGGEYYAQQQQMYNINNNLIGGNDGQQRKVFYQQPDGRFTDAQGEQKNRQQRIVAQHQLDQLRASVPDWMSDDDAKGFAPFFLQVVFAITHVRRMLTGVAAGFSFLILIAIYWAPALEGVSVDSTTNFILDNATIAGAYDVLCLPETISGKKCSSIVAYASVYRPTSYFFLIISLLSLFGSLVPFTFDLALMRVRTPPPTTTATAAAAVTTNFSSGGAHGNSNNNVNAANPNSFFSPKNSEIGGGIAQTTGSAIPAFLGGIANDTGNNNNNNNNDNNDRARQQIIQQQSPEAVVGYMTVRHLVASTFLLFFVALITCMVTAQVEVDRRISGQMISISASQADTIRAALIVRSICFIFAWVCGFRYKERIEYDQLYNERAVIDLRS